METDTAVALAFFAGSMIIAAAMVLVAMTALRDAKRGPSAQTRDGSLPAPFAPDDESPLGATDQGSTEQTARETRSSRPDEPVR